MGIRVSQPGRETTRRTRIQACSWWACSSCRHAPLALRGFARGLGKGAHVGHVPFHDRVSVLLDGAFEVAGRTQPPLLRTGGLSAWGQNKPPRLAAKAAPLAWRRQGSRPRRVQKVAAPILRRCTSFHSASLTRGAGRQKGCDTNEMTVSLFLPPTSSHCILASPRSIR